ncbi:hypothetical protein ACF0H5_008421 [Mactra antiquata]
MDVCLLGRCQSVNATRPTGDKGQFGRCHSAYTRSTDNGQYRIQMTYCPAVNRRPTTSYSNRQGFTPSPRIHSAVSRAAMATPRAQVSTAGFYDWSVEEFDDIPMSSVYQKIAVTNNSKYNKSSRHWCADGVHVNPGRMFVRDKAQLTKGEREIIAGIYKNRGDINNKNGVNAHVKSHKDAWLVGKNIQKKGNSNNNVNTTECEKCLISVPEYLFSRIDNQKKSSSPDEFMCATCRTVDSVPPAELFTDRSQTERKGNGIKAPPSSPSANETTSRKQPKLPKSKASEGAIVIESGKTFYDPQEGKKKKVFVDVFLPKFPTSQLIEEPTSISPRDESDTVKSKESDPVKTELENRKDSSNSSQTKSTRVRQKLFQAQNTPRNRDSYSGE